MASELIRLSADSIISIGGTALTCVTDASIAVSGTSHVSKCEDANGFVDAIAGSKTAKLSLSGELGDEDVSELTTLEAGGALVLQPSGNVSGKLEYTGTLVLDGDVNIVYGRDSGVSTWSASYHINGYDKAAITP